MLGKSKPTIAVVQVCAFKMRAGTTHNLDDLIDGVVPSRSSWEDLTEEPESAGSPLSCAFDNCQLKEDVIGLVFSSVGDWPKGSWFEDEVQMVGIEDTIEPWKDALLKDVEEEMETKNAVFREGEPDSCSILTLWEGQSWQDWEGEYEFDYDYLGVLGDLRKAL